MKNQVTDCVQASDLRAIFGSSAKQLKELSRKIRAARNQSKHKKLQTYVVTPRTLEAIRRFNEKHPGIPIPTILKVGDIITCIDNEREGVQRCNETGKVIPMAKFVPALVEVFSARGTPRGAKKFMAAIALNASFALPQDGSIPLKRLESPRTASRVVKETHCFAGCIRTHDGQSDEVKEEIFSARTALNQDFRTRLQEYHATRREELSSENAHEAATISLPQASAVRIRDITEPALAA